MQNSQLNPSFLSSWVQKFILFLRSERNASEHTLKAYQTDLEGFLMHLKKKKVTSLDALKDFKNSRTIVRDYWGRTCQHLHPFSYLTP